MEERSCFVCGLKGHLKNAYRKNPQNQNSQVKGVNRIQVYSSDLAIPTPLLNQSVADRAPDAELASAFMGAMTGAIDLQVNRVNLLELYCR